MHFFKKVTLTLMIAMFSLSLYACTPKDEAALAADAAKKIAAAESFTGTLAVEMETSASDIQTSVRVDSEITTVYSPFSTKNSTTSSINGGDETHMDIYTVTENDALTTYMKYDNEWVKQSATMDALAPSLRIYDNPKNLAAFLEKGTYWTTESKEDQIVTLKGTLTADALKTLVEETKAFQMVGMTMLEPSFFDGISDTTMTAVIDTKTGYPKELSIGLGEVLQVVTNNVLRSLSPDTFTEDSISVAHYNLTIRIQDINNVSSVDVPADILSSAVDMNSVLEEQPSEEAPETSSKTPATDEAPAAEPAPDAE